MKKKILIGGTIIMLWGGMLNTYANEIEMYLNGEKIKPLQTHHQGAIVKDEVLYLPLRNVFEAMGAEVIYDEEDIKRVSGGKGIIYYTNNIGTQMLITNDEEYDLHHATIIVNDRTLIVEDALRYIFNAEVQFVNDRVDISYEEFSDIWEIDFSNAPVETE